jgi:hypothetical protein
MKTIDTLVDDIYKMLEDKKAADWVDEDTIIEAFGESMKQLLKQQVLTKREDRRTLRMSNLGRKDRYLWFLNKGYESEKMTPATLMKFLYGHATEELVLALAELAGHTVTHKQAKAELNGIKGSMDCCIDDVLIDVKTASSFGFKKFKEGTIRDNDPFGYIDQLKAYAKSLDKDEGGWLAIDKGQGHLAVHTESFKYDEPILDRIEYLKEMVEEEEMPIQCHPVVPDGKSGNMKLAMECSYCVYKKHCFPDVKVFAYSTGPKFLTVIKNYPKVYEIVDYFDDK